MKSNVQFAATYTVWCDDNKATRDRLERLGKPHNLPPRMRSSEVGFDAEDGVYRWTSNGAIPPEDCYASHGIDQLPNFDLAKQREVDERELRAFVADYKARQPKEPSAEEMFELRAAFGPGAEVVDVISGRRVRT